MRDEQGEAGAEEAGTARPEREKILSGRLFWGIGVLLCLVSVPLACAAGPLGFAFPDVLAALGALLTGAPPPTTVDAVAPGGAPHVLDGAMLRLVVLDMRLPRVLLALLAGAGLAMAGAVFQAILRNPLADPFTLGVSGGAAFGAALAISLGLTGAVWGFGLPLFSLAGAGIALCAVLVLGQIGGGLRHETLILAGVVVSAFLAALIALVKALDEASVTGIVFWIMGSFQGRGRQELLLLLPGFCLGGGLALLLHRELDILSIGDRAAQHLGLATARARLALLLAASVVTASCVAVSGIIGFVGLIVPHLCRMILGAEHRSLLPASALCGGLLLLWSDTAARTLLPGGVELPVGVITALLGGPFFCFLLGKRQGRPEAAPRARLGGREFPEPGCAGERRVQGPVPVHAPRSGYRGSHVVCDGLYAGYGRPKKGRVTPAGGGAETGGADSGGRPVLSGIAFSLLGGEFTGLLGPNGSGKSTLLRCLSGLMVPWGGEVRVADQPIAALAERKRALLLACLPQHPEAVPSLSAFAMVLMGRYARTPFLGGYGPCDWSAAWDALRESGAEHLAARPANCLSGGELQRVLLARALAQETDVLFLDEATAGLDPGCQSAVLAALIRRNCSRGLTVFAAMHDLNLAALCCRRLIFLKQGRIVADGPTEEVFTEEILHTVYDCRLTVIRHPLSGRPQALGELPGEHPGAIDAR